MDERGIEVLLYGVGAIGSFYAYILQKSNNVRLSVVARSNHEAIRSNGILIKSENHGEHLFRPMHVLRKPNEAGHTFDFVVCCNKATDLEGTAKELADVVEDEKTVIVILQNGVGNEDPFHRAFPGNTILSAAVWTRSTQYAPGTIRQESAEGTDIGIYLPPGSVTWTPTQQDDLTRFIVLLEYGKSPFTVYDNIQTQRWKKVIWNCAWNPLTALTACTTQEWLTSSDLAVSLSRRVMNEAIDVARAAGVPGIEHDLVDEFMEKINILPGLYASMYYDTVNGSSMEVEVILGTPVRKARELGVSTPTLDILYAMVKAVDMRMKIVRNSIDA
ncbi:hypothetical protein DV736_g2511, partial [Chaetothyriales sp. CBS 134916]